MAPMAALPLPDVNFYKGGFNGPNAFTSPVNDEFPQNRVVKDECQSVAPNFDYCDGRMPDPSKIGSLAHNNKLNCYFFTRSCEFFLSRFFVCAFFVFFTARHSPP